MGIPTRAEVDALVRDRLAADPEFRAALLADPRGALSGLVGMDIPDAVTVEVHEESLTAIHLVVPPVASQELSDDDLEAVAGGVCWGNCTDFGP